MGGQVSIRGYEVDAARRTFLRLGAGLALAFTRPLQAGAQDRARVFQFGVIASNTPTADLVGPAPKAPAAKALREGLRDCGWIDGNNIRIHWRSAEQRYERRPALIEELVRLPVDVLLASGNAATQEVRETTRAIPVVAVGLTQPVKARLVTSIARPGGNVTGLMLDAGVDIESKRLSLLKQIAPRVTRVAFLMPAHMSGGDALDYAPETVAAARALGLAIFPQEFENIDRIEPAVDAAVRQGANGLFVGNWAEFFLSENQSRVARAAARRRLPAVYTYADASRSGGLIAYGADWDALYRRAGYLVDRILKGAKPAEMPLEQASRYILEINVRAARAIGLKVPASLLVSADRVVE